MVSKVQQKEGEITLSEAFTIDLNPQEADVFIGYSTNHGKVSPISPKNGTRFFQVLSQHLEDNYQSKPLDLIYTSVTDAAAKWVHLINDKDGMYVPQKVSTLRANLFLTAKPQNKVLNLRNTL